MFDIKAHFHGGSRISPRWEAPTHDFVKISQKLHEIERIWTRGEVSRHPKLYYVDPPPAFVLSFSDLFWSVSVKACTISDQLGLQPLFLEWLAWFIKKSKQCNWSDITSNIALLTMMLYVNRPLKRQVTGYWSGRNVEIVFHLCKIVCWCEPHQCEITSSNVLSNLQWLVTCWWVHWRGWQIKEKQAEYWRKITRPSLLNVYRLSLRVRY